MTTNLSKSQLATILSALDGERRSPANRDAALRAIGRRPSGSASPRRGPGGADGLLDGRLDAEAWRAELGLPEHGAGKPSEPDLATENACLRARIVELEQQLAAWILPRQATGQPRQGTKEELVIGLLRRSEGATLVQIVEAIGWQAHTVRGAFAGALEEEARAGGELRARRQVASASTGSLPNSRTTLPAPSQGHLRRC